MLVSLQTITMTVDLLLNKQCALKQCENM